MHFSLEYWIFSLIEPILSNDERFELNFHAFAGSCLWFVKFRLFAQSMGNLASDNLRLLIFDCCIDAIKRSRCPQAALPESSTASGL